MPDHDAIYNEEAGKYELMISKEDHEGHILKTLHEIVDLQGKDVVDIGAGTGRLTRLVAPYVKSIKSYDLSRHMLDVISAKLSAQHYKHFETKVSDLRTIPVEENSVDVVMADWSICYLASSNHPEWKENLETVIKEIHRVLRPNGKIVIFETLGTGYVEPNPPDFLTQYYQELEQVYDFHHKSIRTDYAFESMEEMRELIPFFFGEDLQKAFDDLKQPLLPECTGVWWTEIKSR
ncbi:MAG TPA: class I SAM-dependent methyltransferase [Bacillales bacterium]